MGFHRIRTINRQAWKVNPTAKTAFKGEKLDECF
jgi:hypothetical protein